MTDKKEVVIIQRCLRRGISQGRSLKNRGCFGPNSTQWYGMSM